MTKLLEQFRCRCRPEKWMSGTFDCVVERIRTGCPIASRGSCHGDSTEDARELAACEALARMMLKVYRWMRKGMTAAEDSKLG